MIMDYVVSQQEIEEKKEEYKRKKLREIVNNNAKSSRGFGYNYKPIQFPED
jgi:hypothetical protein